MLGVVQEKDAEHRQADGEPERLCGELVQSRSDGSLADELPYREQAGKREEPALGPRCTGSER
ncbi:MAG: hypothetical protein ACKPKO_27105, partial [Candidatus Fonsibacter sp.]